MNKTSKLDLNMTVKALLENELGMLLFQSDNTKLDMYELLADKSTYNDRQGMYGNDTHVTYHLFPLYYHKGHETNSYIIKTRADAIKNIFIRWTELGYNKHHAKNPYNCKDFIAFLDSLEWYDADYLLLMVE